MNPWGLWDLDPLGNHKHPCASRTGVYIGFRGALNPVDSSYNLYLTAVKNHVCFDSVVCLELTFNTDKSGR